MLADVAVIVPTFGDKSVWRPLAERAAESVMEQTVQPRSVILRHRDSLFEARNDAAQDTNCSWLIFLDADDALDPHYIEKMFEGDGDVRQPSTLGVTDGVEDDYPVLIPPKRSLLVGNHLIIGSMVKRSLYHSVGGFRDLPVLEDWDLWIRCALAGASITACPEAIYRVTVREGSRNTDHGLHGQVYRQIQDEYVPQWIEKFGNW